MKYASAFLCFMVGLVSLSPVIEMSSSIHCLQPCNCSALSD